MAKVHRHQHRKPIVPAFRDFFPNFEKFKMAGVKGRSGGARPNSGGHRQGAGRPRKRSLDQQHRSAGISVLPGDEWCFVYVIYECDTPTICKIGVASDVAQRLATMQVGTWRTLKVGSALRLASKSCAHAVERQVHQALRALHCRGEWFHVSPDRAGREVEIAGDQLRAVIEAATYSSGEADGIQAQGIR